MIVQTYSTIKALEHLQTLYQQGYRSEVVDRAIEKVVTLERQQASKIVADLETRLREFEVRYLMSSEDFYTRFHTGELGDDMDFVEWNAFYEMSQASLARIETLSST